MAGMNQPVGQGLPGEGQIPHPKTVGVLVGAPLETPVLKLVAKCPQHPLYHHQRSMYEEVHLVICQAHQLDIYRRHLSQSLLEGLVEAGEPTTEAGVGQMAGCHLTYDLMKGVGR